REHLEGRRPAEDGQRGPGRLHPHGRRTVVVEQPGEEGGEICRLPLVGQVEHRHAATASSSASSSFAEPADPVGSSLYCSRNSRSSAVIRRGRCASKSNGTIT